MTFTGSLKRWAIDTLNSNNNNTNLRLIVLCLIRVLYFLFGFVYISNINEIRLNHVKFVKCKSN